jgi:transglutaminase-like putative cysteine protease
MQINVHHITRYSFSQPQARVIQLLRVTPPSFSGQNVLEWAIDVNCDACLRTGRDGYGNTTTMLYLSGPVETLEVAKRGTVLTQDRSGLVEGLPEMLPPAAYLRQTELSCADEAIAALARLVEGRSPGKLMTLHTLMTAVHNKMRFDVGEGDVARGSVQAFREGHGVCQDFAHIFCAAARSRGIPARYVSGHLMRRDDMLTQPASHAWAEAWIDELGWVGFDVANGVCPDDAYVRVAIGLDYRDAAPLSGVRTGGGMESLDVTVEVAQAGVQLQA